VQLPDERHRNTPGRINCLSNIWTFTIDNHDNQTVADSKQMLVSHDAWRRRSAANQQEQECENAQAHTDA